MTGAASVSDSRAGLRAAARAAVVGTSGGSVGPGAANFGGTGYDAGYVDGLRDALAQVFDVGVSPFGDGDCGLALLLIGVRNQLGCPAGAADSADGTPDLRIVRDADADPQPQRDTVAGTFAEFNGYSGGFFVGSAGRGPVAGVAAESRAAGPDRVVDLRSPAL